MPSVLSKVVALDRQWAQTLVGLRLKVPDKWWDGCTGNNPNSGCIAGVNFEDECSDRHFKFEIDDEQGAFYAMRYDAVFLYADEDQPGYSKYHLPSTPPADPGGEMARAPCRRGPTIQRNLFSGSTSSDDDDDNIPALRVRPSNRLFDSMEEDDEEESDEEESEEEEDGVVYAKTDPRD